MFTKIIRAANDNIINQINIYMSTLTEYDYFEVPLHVFNGLREADSKGRYINKYVIGEYKFRKY